MEDLSVSIHITEKPQAQLFPAHQFSYHTSFWAKKHVTPFMETCHVPQKTTGWCSTPCCSFARHLAGKVIIHCSFAHHQAQPRKSEHLSPPAYFQLPRSSKIPQKLQQPPPNLFSLQLTHLFGPGVSPNPPQQRHLPWNVRLPTTPGFRQVLQNGSCLAGRSFSRAAAARS